MSGMECERLREQGAELALGVLPARERAEAVAHLDRCPDCCEHVERLAAVSDGLLALLPEAEPPVGFESRVVRALGAAPTPKPRGRRLRLAAAAMAATLACGFGGWAVATVVEGAPAAVSQRTNGGLREAALTSAGHEVGRVFAYTGGQGWVYMAVDLPSAGRGPVRCVLVHADGSTVALGSFPLKDGYGYWGSPAPAGPSVTGARLVGPDGNVLATARFATS